MATRTRIMEPADVQQRRADARSYRDTALFLVESDQSADWKTAGSNAILGGIAASDAISGRVLGERHNGDDHGAARKLLDRATSPDTAPGVNLKRLTDEKTNFQYSPSRVTQNKARDLIKALERLIDKMETLLAS